MKNLPPPSPDQKRFERIPQAEDLSLLGSLATSGVEIESSREPAIDREKMLGMLSGSTFSLDAYMPILPSRLQSIDPRQRTGIGFNNVKNHPFMSNFSEDEGTPRLRFSLNGSGVDKLLSEGNSELIVKHGLGYTMGQLRPDSKKPSEEAVAIQYQVLAGYRPEATLSEQAQNNKSKFSNSGSNADPQFFAAIVLPASEATELIDAVREDPQLIREAIELEVQEVMGLAQEWTDSTYCIRPPYERWHKNSDGKDRMTLIEYSPGQSQSVSTLEFSASY